MVSLEIMIIVIIIISIEKLKHSNPDWGVERKNPQHVSPATDKLHCATQIRVGGLRDGFHLSREQASGEQAERGPVQRKVPRKIISGRLR